MVLERSVPLLQQEEEEFGPDERIHGETHNANKKLRKKKKQKRRVHTRRLRFGSVLLSRFTNTFTFIYIYAFSRRFYPKRLTLHSSYSFYILSALAFPGNRTHDLGIAGAMLYHLSYRKAQTQGARRRGIHNMKDFNNPVTWDTGIAGDTEHKDDV